MFIFCFKFEPSFSRYPEFLVTNVRTSEKLRVSQETSIMSLPLLI